MNPRAFTLVELLIVVVILGILAAVVVPQFSDASGDAKLSAMTQDLALVRMQLQIYKLQHKGTVPLLKDFEAVMTDATDENGAVTKGGKYGPYLERIPINPFTGDSTVGNGEVGTSSWYYDGATGEFRANCHNAHVSY